MSQSVLSVRMDENVKRRFDAFCADAGMNASVAVNLFVRTVIREKKIPFEITGNDDPFYSEKNQSRLRASIEQLEAGLGVEHELIEVDDE
ncbi:MAG: type II toxin-antitoxin system RelB/DinJ family antitoxin [Oscillospiraceae bacterium]|nr:type II toxin-antitoxin system RelB/DinJ family antitoxin [Oscillospiraceae bacterium]